jgi:hypothetical protein
LKGRGGRRRSSRDVVATRGGAHTLSRFRASQAQSACCPCPVGLASYDTNSLSSLVLERGKQLSCSLLLETASARIWLRHYDHTANSQQLICFV